LLITARGCVQRACDVPLVFVVGATKPQCGTQIGSSPLQHVRAQAHPGGHWLDFVQAIACGLPQLMDWWQWQQPSTVTTQ
jgi:hypothetical protein